MGHHRPDRHPQGGRSPPASPATSPRLPPARPCQRRYCGVGGCLCSSLSVRIWVASGSDRILGGTPERSNGALTIVALATEAGVPRNALTQRHTDLKNDFYDRVRGRGGTPDSERRLRQQPQAQGTAGCRYGRDRPAEGRRRSPRRRPAPGHSREPDSAPAADGAGLCGPRAARAVPALSQRMQSPATEGRWSEAVSGCGART